jgi:hypothetical protein
MMMAKKEVPMANDVLIFWLIHLFILLVMPLAMYMGCCRTEQKPQEDSTVHNGSS